MGLCEHRLTVDETLEREHMAKLPETSGQIYVVAHEPFFSMFRPSMLSLISKPLWPGSEHVRFRPPVASVQRRVWHDAGCSLPEDKAACAALRNGRRRTAPNEQRRRRLLPLTPSFTVSHDDSRLSLPVRSGHEPFSPSQLYNLTLPVPPHYNYSPVIPRYQLIKTPTSTS